MAVKKKNVMSMEDEDRAFFEAAAKDPKIKAQMEEDAKRADELFRTQSKRLIADQQKKKKKATQK